MDILKLHWNYTEKPLDGVHWNYTGITLKCHWMDTLKVHWNSTAPQAHPKCISSAPQMHLPPTPNAPPTHLQSTPTAPPKHPNCTSNSAPPSTPTSFTYLHPHLQRTSTAPPSTTTFTNPCLAIKSEVHLSAPQKCTPPRVRCAPPSTSAHRGYWCPGAKAAGHQYPQYWLNIHRIGAVSYKNITIMVNIIRK